MVHRYRLPEYGSEWQFPALHFLPYPTYPNTKYPPSHCWHHTSCVISSNVSDDPIYQTTRRHILYRYSTLTIDVCYCNKWTLRRTRYVTTKNTSWKFVLLKEHDERRLGTAKTLPRLRNWFLRNVGTFLTGLHNAVTQKATTKIFIVLRNSNPITYMRFQRLWQNRLLHLTPTEIWREYSTTIIIN
jgi:hypothetical protein